MKDFAKTLLSNKLLFLDITDGATHYHADYVNPQWGLPKTTQIGRHIFYKRQSDLVTMKKEIKI